MVQKSFSKVFGRQIGSKNHSLDSRCFSLKIKTMFNITGQHLVAASCSVAKSCPTLCNSVNCSSPGFSVLHYLLEISLESVMLSNHLILCHPLLFLPSIFPSIRVFSFELVLIRWPKHWSFSFSHSPSSEYSVLISFRIDWFDFLAVQGTLNSLLQHHNLKASSLVPCLCDRNRNISRYLNYWVNLLSCW